MDIILHLGAHRTGTTTFQQVMGQNEPALDRAFVAFWGPKRTRSGLFNGLIKRREQVDETVRKQAERSAHVIQIELDRLADARCRALLVSEENMLGAIPQNLSQRKLYPDAQFRLNRVAIAFAHRVTHVALSIRSYEAWWPSALSYAVPAGAAMPSGAALDHLVTQPRRWRHVIEEVAQAFPKARVSVWAFESMIGNVQGQLAMAMGGAAPVLLRGSAAWHHRSASASDLRRVLTDRGEFDTAARVPRGAWRYQPFGPHHLDALAGQYHEDLTWLRGGADGLATYYDTPDAIPGVARLGKRGSRDVIEERGLGQAR
ncbi:MAG: hypothetical protein ACWA47_05340 [Brevirhabdus sp.]